MERETKEKILKDLKRDIELKSRSWHIFGYEPEDLEQELTLHIWRQLDKFDESRSGVRTYCITIMNNKLRNFFRDEDRKTLNHAVFLGFDSDITEDGKVVRKY
jgi:DNA-directed RNA polymerase specialized sigma24 family protein